MFIGIGGRTTAGRGMRGPQVENLCYGAVAATTAALPVRGNLGLPRDGLSVLHEQARPDGGPAVKAHLGCAFDCLKRKRPGGLFRAIP